MTFLALSRLFSNICLSSNNFCPVLNRPTTFSISPGMSYSSSSSSSLAAAVITWFCTTEPWACRLAARDRQPRWYLHKKQTQLISFSDSSSNWNNPIEPACQVTAPPSVQLSSYLVAALKEREKYPIFLPPDPVVSFPKQEGPDYLNGSVSLSLPSLFQYNLLSIADNREKQNSHALKTSPKPKN